MLDFLRRVVLAEFPRGTIYPIWDNLSTHKEALRLWEPKPKRVQFAWTSTNSSRLNLIEAWFSVLERTALHNTHLKTPHRSNSTYSADRLSERASQTLRMVMLISLYL